MTTKIRVFCDKHKRDYETAGYKLYRTAGQKGRQPCDWCGKPGREYIVQEIKKGK